MSNTNDSNQQINNQRYVWCIAAKKDRTTPPKYIPTKEVKSALSLFASREEAELFIFENNLDGCEVVRYN